MKPRQDRFDQNRALRDTRLIGILNLPATIGRGISFLLCSVDFWLKLFLGVVMNRFLALAGALLLSLICENADAQVKRTGRADRAMSVVWGGAEVTG